MNPMETITLETLKAAGRPMDTLELAQATGMAQRAPEWDFTDENGEAECFSVMDQTRVLDRLAVRGEVFLAAEHLDLPGGYATADHCGYDAVKRESFTRMMRVLHEETWDEIQSEAV